MKAQPAEKIIDIKENIDFMLERIQELSDEHFGIDPEYANWSDVADISRIHDLLAQANDILFKEGEYAK